MHNDNKTALFSAMFANLGVALAKFVGFWVTGATSMLAESIHSAADTSNQILLFLGGAKAKKREDESHPFGYGRERFFWSFVVAMVIFSLGALFALYEGTSKLMHPHKMESPEWAIGILLLAILLEGNSLRVAVAQANKLRGEASWWNFIRQAKIPELPVLLLEDFGALIGLVLARLGIGLALLTGDPRFDALGSGAALAVVGGIDCVIGVASLVGGTRTGADIALADSARLVAAVRRTRQAVVTTC